MPVDQCNARLDPGLVMRVGVPHRGGKLAFHAFNHDYPVMVSANAFCNPKTRTFHFPKASDIEELDFALDSAGFTAMKLWQAKGEQPGMAGIFPWTYAHSTSNSRRRLAPPGGCSPTFAASPRLPGAKTRSTTA